MCAPLSLSLQILRFSEADFTPDRLPRVIHRFTIMAGAPPPPPEADADDPDDAGAPRVTFHVVNEDEIADLPIFLNSSTGMFDRGARSSSRGV